MTVLAVMIEMREPHHIEIEKKKNAERAAGDAVCRFVLEKLAVNGLVQQTPMQRSGERGEEDESNRKTSAPWQQRGYAEDERSHARYERKQPEIDRCRGEIPHAPLPGDWMRLYRLRARPIQPDLLWRGPLSGEIRRKMRFYVSGIDHLSKGDAPK
jgi:hypothetical protein